MRDTKVWSTSCVSSVRAVYFFASEMNLAVSAVLLLALAMVSLNVVSALIVLLHIPVTASGIDHHQSFPTHDLRTAS